MRGQAPEFQPELEYKNGAIGIRHNRSSQSNHCLTEDCDAM